ncbi:hypothetical protein WAI453_002350 [Rhynchosporium graminicola]
MSYSSKEQDSLLPDKRQSAEVQGSRLQRITDEYSKQAPPHNTQPKKSIWSHYVPMIKGLCIVVSVVVVFMSFEIPGNEGTYSKTIEQRVNRILEDTPLIDGHNDLAIIIRAYYNNHIYGENFTSRFEEGGMEAHVDIPRLREGKNGGAFWSAFVPCPENGSDFSNGNYAGAVAFTYNQIDVLKRLQAAYPSTFSPPPPTAKVVLSYFQSGRLISPLGIEGLHQIGNSLSNLRNFYALGARYITLTHNCHNAYADAAMLELPNGDVEISRPKWNGVSPAGRDLIREMNRLGMIVDLSHVSQDTMRDVLGGSKDWDGSAAPVIFSHSSAYAICPHPRNVPDSILNLVNKRNSIVMVNFSPDFVSCFANSSSLTGSTYYPKNSTLEHVVDHIVYIGEKIGFEHVGLGSDFDGIEATPRGLEDVSKFPDLVAELLRRGISDKDAGKVVGGNILRVWKDVDEVAAKMQKAGVKPLEDVQLPPW